MKKNYLNEGMKLLLVGICLVLAAAFSETAVDGLLWGFAGGALAPGIARIIQHFYWSAPKNQVRYQEMKEQADINLHDELNEKLRDKSGRIAYLIGLLIICISEVVFSILGNAGIISNHKVIVLYKDLKELMADLKRIYAAVDEPSALDALEDFAGKWDKKYPKISKSWRDNWANLSTYFKFPEEVRRLIYTTNAIEGFNRQLRKVTKSKSVFPTDDSLLKMLYLAMIDITAKWTGRRQDWARIHAQLAIFYEDRLPD